MFAREQILGVKFFNGAVDEAVDVMSTNGGLLVVPAAPALVKICDDEGYRRAVTSADMAIADSGAMVLFWKVFTGRRVERISGLKFLKRLIAPRYLSALRLPALIFRYREKLPPMAAADVGRQKSDVG